MICPPAWNWSGRTLWEEWVQAQHAHHPEGVYYQFLQRYEPIEDEL